MAEPKTITVAELRERLLQPLAALPDGALVYFGAGDLTLAAVHDRSPLIGPPLVQIAFNEVYAVLMDAPREG